jgi:hypothetical protein
MRGKSFAAVSICLAALILTTGCAQSPIGPSASSATPGRALLTGASLHDTIDTVRVRAPLSFTLASCPTLGGLIVYGEGEDVLVMNVRVAQDGTSYIERNDLVTGTATDSSGGSYKFNYHNHSNLTVPPGGFPWSFTTTDHFNLIGNGKAEQLQVHFVARVTFPSPSDPPVIEFVNERGNPFFCDAI